MQKKNGLWFNFTGPGWGRYFVGPIQFGLCYGAVIACILLGGQSLKVSFLFPLRLALTCMLSDLYCDSSSATNKVPQKSLTIFFCFFCS
jgi:hypothetical protein